MNDDLNTNNVLYPTEMSNFHIDTIDMSALAFFNMLSKQFPIKKEVLDAVGLKIIDWENICGQKYLAIEDTECL
jgi:hypothetical protein